MSRQDIFKLLFSAVGLILTFPPFPAGFIATGALVPFFFYLRGKGLKKAFKGGYVLGLLWAGGTIYWIGWATLFGLLGVLLILPFYCALFAVLQGWLWKRWGDNSFVSAPFLWTGIEIISSWGSLAFPWNLLAHTQTYYPSFIQYASITGAYGVSFWVVSLNVLFFFLLSGVWQWRRSLWLVSGIGFLFILPWGYGKWVLSRPVKSKTEIRVDLIQGNIDPYKKWTQSFIDSNFVVYHRLTKRVYNQNSDLIIWPETATPCYLRYRFSYLNRVKSQVDSMKIPLLTGSPDYERRDRKTLKTYNGALLIRPRSWRIDRYYKIHLVPFSERVPLVEKVPFLYDLSKKLDLDIGNFSPGDSVVVFEFNPSSLKQRVRFSVVICYESVFPYLVREFVQKGAQFLVVITNDGWFGKTSGPYQHAQIAVLRAIENRIWVVRCANTGVSEFIDPFGRIRVKTGLNEEAVLGHFISIRSEKSFFLRHGYLFPIFILVANGLIFLIALLRRK